MTVYAPGFERNADPIGSLLAGEAITGLRCVTISTSTSVVMTDSGARVDGVCPIDVASGEPVPIITDGIVVVEAGGTFSDGDALVPTTDGKVIAGTTGSVLTAMEDATSGAQVRCYLRAPAGAAAAAPELVTNTPGALSLATESHFVAPTGTDAMTIAAGTYNGQVVEVTQFGGASTPVVTIGGTFLRANAAVTLGTFVADGYAKLVWRTASAAWLVAFSDGVTWS